MAVILVPKYFVMFIVVYQTNTGHRASSLCNEYNMHNKFTFKYWCCHAFNVLHQLPSFCALFFAIFADEVVLLIFVLQTFSWNHSPIYYVCPHPFFTCNISKYLRYFVLWKVDIGRNLWHSLVLQSQISNFPYSLKKSVSCVKLISLKNFTLSLNETPKAHCFCFLQLIQRSAVQ